MPGSGTVGRSTCAVKSAAAQALERGADLLEMPRGDPEPLRSALAALQRALATMELSATTQLPEAGSLGAEPGSRELVSALDPSFRAQELSFAVTQVGRNIDLTASAERRSWWQRFTGQQPAGVPGPLAAAQERAVAHFERHSVWLHNSVRGAVALGLAVLVANETGVQHSFWVIFGTLSVLRSNALNTGQFIARGILGTSIGFVIGALVLEIIGTDTTLLWVLLPIAVLVAGIAPAAISFTAGQAAFTVALLILFNLVQPAGWRLGIIRIEDVALGFAVSLVVGLLFWPRGAASALRIALAEAYAAARATCSRPSTSACAAATPRARLPTTRPTRRRGRRPRRAGWTTPSAATWPSAGRSPCRSPR